MREEGRFQTSPFKAVTIQNPKSKIEWPNIWLLQTSHPQSRVASSFVSISPVANKVRQKYSLHLKPPQHPNLKWRGVVAWVDVVVAPTRSFCQPEYGIITFDRKIFPM
jgi:hypothetical protein